MNDKKQMVFITEARALDFSPARVYGDLKVLAVGRAVPYTEGLPPNMAFNTDLVHRIRKELAEYVPGHDLLCPTGAPALLMAIGMVVSTLKGRHRMLGWDNHARRYLEYVVEVGHG